MKQIIADRLRESSDLKARMSGDEALLDAINAAAQALQRVASGNGCVYACGNGGSACDAMHLCEELVARFKRERKGFRAMHFMDPSTLTCWANDYDFEGAFERCADTFCTPQDALIGFSTSGSSRNVLRALARARAKGSVTIGLTGKDGGKMPVAVDHCIVVPSDKTERIQEGHIAVVHILCEILER